MHIVRRLCALVLVFVALSLLAAPSSMASGPTLYNPCYDFADDPVAGCYYNWSPQTYCCVHPDPWRCPAVCW